MTTRTKYKIADVVLLCAGVSVFVAWVHAPFWQTLLGSGLLYFAGGFAELAEK